MDEAHEGDHPPCFTPVASPQSDGISEAFGKTPKRDRLRVSPRRQNRA
jgi:hypothetical protein